MREDQERVRNLLTDTVTLLCKNGLQFRKELKVQGLLGITTDDNEVFVVHINEKFGEAIGGSFITIHPGDSSETSAGSSKNVDVTDSGHSPRNMRGKKRPLQGSGGSATPAKRNSVSSSQSQKQKTDTLDIKIKSEEGVYDVDSDENDSKKPSTRGGNNDRDAMRESYSGLSDFGRGNSARSATIIARPVGESSANPSQEELFGLIQAQESSVDSAEHVSDFGETPWDSSAFDEGGDGSMEAVAGTSSTWVTAHEPGRPRNTGHGSQDSPSQPCTTARKRRGKMKRYSHTQMEVAYKSVKIDGIPVKQAAKLHGVPKSTLGDRVNGRFSLDVDHRSKIFSNADENKLVNCVGLVNQIGYGCTRAEFIAFASNFAIHKGKRVKGAQLTQYWIHSFLNRWPEVSMTTKLQTPAKESIVQYYDELSRLIKKYSFTSENVYIVSEKEICLDQALPCVMSTQSIRSHPAVKRIKCVTVTAAVNSAGKVVAPFFVFPSGHEGDITILEGALPDTGLAFSDTGASDPDTMKEYVSSHLAKHIKPSAGSHVLLLYDSHRCPLPLEVQDVAIDQGFVPYYITPPCKEDVNVDYLHPLTKTVKEECTSFVQDHPECTLSTDSICHLVCKAYKKALTLENVAEAFQQIGISDSVG